MITRRFEANAIKRKLGKLEYFTSEDSSDLLNPIAADANIA